MLINGGTPAMPIGHLLESVAGPQNQCLIHMPTDELEPNRPPIDSLATGQGQRWMPAHIERRGEPDPCFNDRWRTTGCRDVCQAPRGAVHGRHDEQIDIAKELVEPTTE